MDIVKKLKDFEQKQKDKELALRAGAEAARSQRGICSELVGMVYDLIQQAGLGVPERDIPVDQWDERCAVAEVMLGAASGMEAVACVQNEVDAGVVGIAMSMLAERGVSSVAELPEDKMVAFQKGLAEECSRESDEPGRALADFRKRYSEPYRKVLSARAEGQGERHVDKLASIIRRRQWAARLVEAYACLMEGHEEEAIGEIEVVARMTGVLGRVGLSNEMQKQESGS